jgi:hypothetical protein
MCLAVNLSAVKVYEQYDCVTATISTGNYSLHYA